MITIRRYNYRGGFGSADPMTWVVHDLIPRPIPHWKTQMTTETGERRIIRDVHPLNVEWETAACLDLHVYGRTLVRQDP